MKEKEIESSIERSIDLKIIKMLFNFTNEVVSKLRILRDKDKVSLIDLDIEIEVPAELFTYRYTDNKTYIDIGVKPYLKHFFKRSNFTFILPYWSKYITRSHQVSIPILSGGFIFIDKDVYPKPKKVDENKLIKEIKKLEQLLSNKHYIANNTIENIKLKEDLLKLKKLSLDEINKF